MIDNVLAKIPNGGSYYAYWGKLLDLMVNESFEVAIVDAGALNKKSRNAE